MLLLGVVVILAILLLKTYLASIHFSKSSLAAVRPSSAGTDVDGDPDIMDIGTSLYVPQREEDEVSGQDQAQDQDQEPGAF